MAHPKRLLMLQILLEEELSVTDLANRCGIKIGTVSRHLTILRSACLVTCKPYGTTCYYSCRSSAVTKMTRTLTDIQFPDADPMWS
ncbi:metalloregulator ArsR/SmtB family transcription factor [Rhizobium sp. VS19-DR104.2]|nr:metalloregulator ArsR/SmtB family transcription factor [Rhizobium sp. VS19-DR96]MBZ5769142.1 metalloregulator ArsR/SmtB family transcription factor [Rhizobium sp. VS19-DR129.2]MBZ5775970.1 metalloregulator ArsR/SmtB family transcription factor [Rhizobium sp. VS19-DRK62.2]MBZ5820222.1 metalloregulator ArsR/SmtB family transcription factor [Rhizobium sp. VS19-DR183]MBZ5832135.1 metalloregulator ArsR/SmtB family transcription factor [Rhizobium sp. VS19-DR104.2]